MAPKKKQNRPENNHVPVVSSQLSHINCCADSNVSSVNHQDKPTTNGHSFDIDNGMPAKVIPLNGCNGTNLSEKTLFTSDSSPNNKVVESNPSVESLGDSLNTITFKSLDSASHEQQIESEKNDVSSSLLDKVIYVQYQSELQMPDIIRLIQKDLSEPYSIYTYRYFIHNWPMLCFLAMYGGKCVGAIVCKLDMHKKVVKRGYIAMLAVDENYRKERIGSNLVIRAIAAMVSDGADEVVLETEITNEPALKLYENLGFVRDKRLFRYYLNGVDALRLKLWLR